MITEKTNTNWLRFYGSNNTRDLGGLCSKDGRRVPKGRLIRSGVLSHVSGHAGKKLKEHDKLQTMIDLRTDGERARHPVPEMKGIEAIHIPVLQSAMLGITEDEASTEDKIKGIMRAGLSEKEFMSRVYTDIISDPHAISAYRALFQVLLAQESGATMYFCSHGRDRTGIATMLILSALDVPIEAIRADYLVMPVQEIRQQRLISTLAFLHRITPEQAQFAKAFSAPSAERFDNALQWIETHYGSVQNYLTKELGIGLSMRLQLQALYLEDIRI